MSHGGVGDPAATWTPVTSGIVSSGDNSQYNRTVVAADHGTYRVTVSNTLSNSNPSSVTSSSVEHHIRPKITVNPNDQWVMPLEIATFDVTASGPHLTYQWYQVATATEGTPSTLINGSAISGATTAQLKVTVDTTDARKGYYYCVVSNNYTPTDPVATSTRARLWVKPRIFVQPSERLQIVGQPVVYSISASGEMPMTYQFYRGNTWHSTHNITSEQIVSSTSFNVLESDADVQYKFKITNAANPTEGLTSDSAALRIPASFNVPPSTTVATLGEPFTFNVSSYGKLPVTYTWYKNGQTYQTRTLSSKTDTLTFPSVINEDGANYKLEVSNEHTAIYKANFGGATQSAEFRLQIKPIILSTPLKNIAAIVGAKIQYSVVAGGSLPLSYQWYKNDSPMSGKTSSELLIASAAIEDSGAYKCKVSNVDGDVFSNTATVAVSTTLGVDAFNTGYMPLGEQKDMTIAGVSYKAMKQPVSNNAAEFTMEGRKVLAAAIPANSGVAAMTVNYAQPVFDGANYKMKFNINVYDSTGTKFHALQNGASMTIVWDLPIEITDLNKSTLTLEHYEDDGVTIKETIIATRRTDGKYESTHTSFSLNVVTTNDVPCFPAGTRILTATGYKAVEDLSAEDKIVTADGRAVLFNRYTTHIAKTTTNTAPYEIAAGAFGRHSPPVAIRLSPLHAIQSRKGVWQIPTYAARSNAGVKQYGVGKSVTYYHIELPNYFTDNIVMEGGAVVESFGSTQTKGLTNVYKYNATLGGFTRISAAATKTVAKK